MTSSPVYGIVHTEAVPQTRHCHHPVLCSVECVAQVVSPTPRYVNGDPVCFQLRYVSWGELQTMVFLQLGISNFLALLSARTRSWYVTGGWAVMAL